MFSTYASLYPAYSIWVSIKGIAALMKSCFRRWSGCANSNCKRHLWALSPSQSRYVPTTIDLLSSHHPARVPHLPCNQYLLSAPIRAIAFANDIQVLGASVESETEAAIHLALLDACAKSVCPQWHPAMSRQRMKN